MDDTERAEASNTSFNAPTCKHMRTCKHTCTHTKEKRVSFQDWRKLGTKGLGKEPIYVRYSMLLV